jgi:diacylglycerol kinase family enzyme
MKVHMDQAEALEHVTPFLFVGNNRYQTAGLEIGTRSRLDSGQLWVCTEPRVNRQNFVHLALKTLVGRNTDQDLSAFEVTEIWVQPGTPRVDVSTDGEVMDAPLHYTIRPKALQVVVPASLIKSNQRRAWSS